MIKNLESPILILHQESAFIHNGMSSIYNVRSSISKNLCSKSTHKSIKTRVLRLDKILLLFRGIFYSIYYATWENLKEIMNVI